MSHENPSHSAAGPLSSAVADDNGNDPKRWSLGKYFWVVVVHALRSGQRPPRLEFHFDNVRAFVLRIDAETPTQFLLVDYGDTEPLRDPDTSAPLDLDALEASGQPLPRSQRLDGQAFPLIIEDDEAPETAGAAPVNVFAREIEGNPAGIAEVYRLVDAVFVAYRRQCAAASSGALAGALPVLNAVVTRWDEQTSVDEVDRRYVDLSLPDAYRPSGGSGEGDSATAPLAPERGYGLEALHVRGTPHPTTVRYSACGCSALQYVRALCAAVNQQCQPLGGAPTS